MIDMNTSNNSFKNVRNVLYQEKVKNTDFMLEIIDTSLAETIEFDRSVLEYPERWSIEFRKQILEECKSNFWFFAREIVRIPTEDNTRHKDPYNLCPRFNIRLDTLRLLYGYNNDMNVMYRTENDAGMDDAVAIMMVYEFIVKGSIHPNFECAPDRIYKKMQRILDLNVYSSFLDNLSDKKFYGGMNESTVNKFIFDFIGNHTKVLANDHAITSCNEIVCIDDLYNTSWPDGVRSVVLHMRDALMPYVISGFEPFTHSVDIFDKKPSNKGIYVRPIYDINKYLKDTTKFRDNK